MTAVTTERANAARAAVKSLNGVLSTYASLSDLTSKSLYAEQTIFPVISESVTLCLQLGNTLVLEQTLNATQALAPFQPDPIRSQLIPGLLSIKSIQEKGRFVLENGAGPYHAVQTATAMVGIFQAVLAYVEAETKAKAEIINAAVRAALDAIRASEPQAVIVGHAVTCALAVAGASSWAADVGEAVEAALAAAETTQNVLPK